MRVDAFDFDLPKHLIAERPISPRDAARLLVVDGNDFLDRHVRDLPALLRPGDCLVVNNTKVIPARLTGHRGDARIELTLHKFEGNGVCRAFARPAKRLRPGDIVRFSERFEAEVLGRDGGEVRLTFNRKDDEFWAALDAHGTMPLPPYIPRSVGPDAQDKCDYQTMFATERGAVAAPTASLHFTPALTSALDARGVNRVEVTLHVGAGTFLPVTTDNTADHKMHSEWGRVSETAATAINEARADGGRIIAAGTTALRLLESAADEGGAVRPLEGDTDLFITPGYRFRAVDRLLTNFHLPRSTLFMLVAAFSGLETMQGAYAHAIAAGYRFYSYGDACLLSPDAGS